MTPQIAIVLLTFLLFVVLILSNKVKIDLAAMGHPDYSGADAGSGIW